MISNCYCSSTFLDRQTDRRQDGRTGGGCDWRLGGRLVENVVGSRWAGKTWGKGLWGCRRGRGRTSGHPLPRAQCWPAGQSQPATVEWAAVRCATSGSRERIPCPPLRVSFLQHLLPQAFHLGPGCWPPESLCAGLCAAWGAGRPLGLCLHGHTHSQPQQCGWHLKRRPCAGDLTHPRCLHTPAGHQSALPAGG